MKKRVRIIIDTNLWVSWLIKKRETRLSQILSNSSLEIVSSHEQASELFEVIERSKFHKLVPSEIIEEFKTYFLQAVELYKVKISVEASRDKKDNFLLALAKTAQANYLLTGDKDLLIIEKFAGTNIITLTEFLNKKQ